MESIDVPRDDADTHDEEWWATNNCLLVVDVKVVDGCPMCRQRHFCEDLEGEVGSSIPSPKTFSSGVSPFIP